MQVVLDISNNRSARLVGLDVLRGLFVLPFRLGCSGGVSLFSLTEIKYRFEARPPTFATVLTVFSFNS